MFLGEVIFDYLLYPLNSVYPRLKGMEYMKLQKSKKDEEVYYYFLKNGEKRWMYRHKYYDALGKRKEKKKSGFKTEKEALKSLLEVKASILSGQTSYIEHSQMTVSQWMDIWFEAKNRSWEPSTVIMIERAIKNQIKPLIGRYKLSQLNATTYEREFINKLYDKGYKNGSVSIYHNFFKMAINAAVEDEIILKNRFSSIKIEKDDKLENFLTPEELGIFLSYAKKHGNITQYTLVLLLAFSGLRKGEAYGLKWKNVNFTDNTITIDCTRDKNGERPPKTKNSNRTIEIDENVMEQLKKYQKWCIKKKLSFGLHLDKENDYVFISKNNINGVHDQYVNIFFNTLYKIMEMNEVKINTITPHGLRHTHATILIDELIPPTDVADRLGNTLEMIYKIYAHSFKKVENRTVVAFSRRLKRIANSN